MKYYRIYIVLIITVLASLYSCNTGSGPKESDQDTKPKNILFIAIDDLKPELGCYGYDHMQTPNIDKLATQGFVFKNNHCQQAVCGPSRASILTGKRPDIIPKCGI